MWRGRVAPLNNLKYILKLLNNMQVNGFLKDKPSNFCCLTGKKFKEKRIYSKTHNYLYIGEVRYADRMNQHGMRVVFRGETLRRKTSTARDAA